MGASNETFSKREKEKAKQKKKQEKQEKRDDRKSNLTKGQSLDQMLAYVDENGNISSRPPDPGKVKVIDQQDIRLGAAEQPKDAPEDVIRQGVVSFFNNSKGYGFIRDIQNQQSIFVHLNGLVDPVQENDKVSFSIETTPKGPSAVQVKKITVT